MGCARKCELGYGLHTAHWGKGYATEAVALFVAWFYDRHPEQQLFAVTSNTNLGSIAVLKKCNFTEASVEERKCHPASNLGDDILWLDRSHVK